SKSQGDGIRSPCIDDLLGLVPFADDAGIEDPIHQFVDDDLLDQDLEAIRKILEQVMGQGPWWLYLLFQGNGNGLCLKGPDDNGELSVSIHFVQDQGIGPILCLAI